MKVITNRFIPFRGFTAISLCGVVFVRRGHKIDKVMLNHEYIHALQQREMLWLPFFIAYLAEWLVGLIRYRSAMKAYRNISFEREAYIHEHDLDYAKHRQHYAQYRKCGTRRRAEKC